VARKPDYRTERLTGGEVRIGATAHKRRAGFWVYFLFGGIWTAMMFVPLCLGAARYLLQWIDRETFWAELPHALSSVSFWGTALWGVVVFPFLALFGPGFLWFSLSMLTDRQEWYAGRGFLEVRRYWMGWRRHTRRYDAGRLVIERKSRYADDGELASYDWWFYLLHRERKVALDYVLAGKQEEPTELIEAASAIGNATGWPLLLPDSFLEPEPRSTVL
jgi:hypothetical protein